MKLVKSQAWILSKTVRVTGLRNNKLLSIFILLPINISNCLKVEKSLYCLDWQQNLTPNHTIKHFRDFSPPPISPFLLS